MKLLELHQISKSFGKKKIFSSEQNLVADGGLIALVGKNGSGKSTLLRIAASLVCPSAGSVWIDGKPLERNLPFAQNLLGYAEGNENGFFPRLTGRENLQLFSYHRKRKEPDLSFWGHFPSGALETPFQDCSSGMKHSLHLARALLHRPKILLLDEISKSFDQELRLAFRNFLKEYQKHSLILLATHDTEEIQMASQLWKIENGVVFSQ